MEQYILHFSSRDATHAAVGGKGANLAGLIRAGFAVPGGFFITTDAYRRFAAANTIGARLLPLIEAVTPDDPRSLDAVSAEVRGLFERGKLLSDIEQPILAAYNALIHPDTLKPKVENRTLPVAVRSSATAEDLPGLSFAGQQDTHLNIVGEEALIDAVKKCWGSLWTARAIGYRARNRIPSDNVALAVVVQRMIASEVSGVLFTANPLTGRRDEIVIEASYGLGEAIVSGQVEPDNYAVDSQRWRIVRRKLGAKALAIVPQEGGGTQQIMQDAAHKQALSDAQILDLARIAQRIAAHFGTAQDIEWAWANAQFHILQSRPITSLYPLPDLPTPPDELRAYMSLNSVQGVTDPFTPLGADNLRLFLSGVENVIPLERRITEFVTVAGGRLFADIAPLLRDPRARRVVISVLGGADPGARQIFSRLVAEGWFTSKRLLTVARVLRLIATLRPLLFRMLMAWWRPEPMRSRAIAQADHLLLQFRQRVQTPDSLAARLAAMERDVPRVLSEFFLKTLIPVIAPGLISMSIVDHWLIAWLDAAPGAVLPLLRSLPGNVTTQMDLRLWALSQTIRADPDASNALRAEPVDALVDANEQGNLPTVAQNALAQFLDEYGMRAVGEIDVGRPRWRENPMQIIQTLRSYLQIDDPDLAPDRLFKKGADNAERLAAQYIAQVRRTRWGWLRGKLLTMMIRRIRLLGGLRESPKLYMIKAFDIYRSVVLESGRELVAKRALERAEDIFFVPLNVLKQVAQGETIDLKALVAVQRTDYERERARRQLPRVLLSTGETFYEGLSEEGTSDLVGSGVSPGVVEGRVRVVLDPHGVKLEPGEILVCPATDPGWTPLFLSAGGLVMELGGLVTHGSVVAREYGIPAVVGVHQATTRLHTGQQVRVDGSLGRITLLDTPSSGATPGTDSIISSK